MRLYSFYDHLERYLSHCRFSHVVSSLDTKYATFNILINELTQIQALHFELLFIVVLNYKLSCSGTFGETILL